MALTGQRHPQLPPQRLRDPHGDEPLRLLRAEHVHAAAELREVVFPQLLPQLFRALKQPPHLLLDNYCNMAGVANPRLAGRMWLFG